MPTQAYWNGALLAESTACVTVEGNAYFPPDSVTRAYFTASPTQTVCPWKGTAHYYTVVVEGQQNPDAAWYYPQTKPEAKQIEGYIAFWKGVEVRDTP